MSRGVAVKDLDTAGGKQLAGGQTLVTINGKPIVLQGDPVAGHGDSPHNSPTMVEGSSLFKINGIPVVLDGHKASCGHTSTGRPLVTVSR
jgi:uncharacterized Zn-binding protein involved in type VI secretion